MKAKQHDMDACREPGLDVRRGGGEADARETAAERLQAS
jgi:hypothetical protein